jgi:hypothetical protein
VGEEVSNETSNKTSNTKVAEKCKYLDSLRKIDQKIRVGALRPLQALSRIWRDGFCRRFCRICSLSGLQLPDARLDRGRARDVPADDLSTDDSSHASVSAISRMVKPRTLRLDAGVKSKPGGEDSTKRDRLRHHEASTQDQD